jgi:PPOX class probable F420-dependent enzyme
VTTLDAGEARRRFAQAQVARFATVTPAGRPHLVPIVFALEGDTLYSTVDPKPKESPKLWRLRNIEANPRVAVLADHYQDDWTGLWWARADGSAEVVEEGPVRDHAVGLLRSRYPQYESLTDPFGAAVVVHVERWSGWSLE